MYQFDEMNKAGKLVVWGKEFLCRPGTLCKAELELTKDGDKIQLHAFGADLSGAIIDLYSKYLRAIDKMPEFAPPALPKPEPVEYTDFTPVVPGDDEIPF